MVGRETGDRVVVLEMTATISKYHICVIGTPAS